MDAHTSNHVGALGERIAAEFLERRGVRVVERNAFVDRDEMDIIYRGGVGLVAVEVKTVSNGTDPFAAITHEKMKRLRRAAAGYAHPIVAIDGIGVTLCDWGMEVRWLRGIG